MNPFIRRPQAAASPFVGGGFFAGRSGKPYVPPVVNAVAFDGSTYLLRSGALTGAVPGKKLTISFWFRSDAGDGTTRDILNSTGGALRIFQDSSNRIDVRAENAGGTVVLRYHTGNVVTAPVGSGWHHMVMSADLGQAAAPGTARILIDGSVGQPATHTNDNMALDAADFSLGAALAGTPAFTGGLAELWIGAVHLDLTSPTNLRRFRIAGKPARLGANGELVTGSPPLVYMPNPAATFGDNAGLGGDFTVAAGALTDTDAP
jgi:hypothetical protein